jgi:6-phosphogluconolactonase/glucosamine-6-phosphate isomerase/deaminase
MHLFQFDSIETWAETAASLWRDRLHVQPHLFHCLASGHTPNPIFALMADSCRRGLVSFSQATVFALDEYGGLSPDDSGRCANMLRHHLVSHIDLPRHEFHTFDPDAPDLDRVCDEFDIAIGKGFDLTLLGIGLNGHLGMNEPGSAPDSPTRRVQLHPKSVESSAKYLAHDQLPTWGLSVGMKRLLASREVWLLATGSAKAEIVLRTVTGETSPSLPASLLQNHPNCYLFLDRPAAALL